MNSSDDEILSKRQHSRDADSRQKMYRCLLWVVVIAFMIYWMPIWKQNDYIRYYNKQLEFIYACQVSPIYCKLDKINIDGINLTDINVSRTNYSLNYYPTSLNDKNNTFNYTLVNKALNISVEEIEAIIDRKMKTETKWQDHVKRILYAPLGIMILMYLYYGSLHLEEIILRRRKQREIDMVAEKKIRDLNRGDNNGEDV